MGQLLALVFWALATKTVLAMSNNGIITKLIALKRFFRK
jgi:hypothetical protein